MHQKRYFPKLSFLLIMVSLSAFMAQSQEFVQDKEKSHIKFVTTAKMLGISSEVPGQFTDFTIRAVRRPKIEDCEVQVIIPVKSIDTNISLRDRHLRSEDFFDEKKYNNMIFKSKKIRQLKNNLFEVSGDLLVKDKSSTVSFQVAVEPVNEKNQIWHLKSEFSLSRNAVGISYKSPFYLPDIGDEVKAILDIQLAPKSAK